MNRMTLPLCVALAGFLYMGNQADAGHGYYAAPVPIAYSAPVYYAPVYTAPVVTTYYQPGYVVSQPVITPYYYPVTTYYAPAPVYTYPAYYPAYGGEVEVKYKWRHGRYKVEYDFDD